MNNFFTFFIMVEVKIIFFNLYMDKYYLYIVNNKKSILLSSSDSKTELRKKGLENIGDKIEKYNGLYLYRVKIMKVPKKYLEKEEDRTIKLIGGPWMAIIERILIDYNDRRTKLKSVDAHGNTRIYFSEKYFKKYDSIQQDSINNLIFDYVHKKFSDALFAINTVDK
jgi:hypothetical protein